MSIRYDQGYNSEIRRIVKNFNQKRNRAYQRGFRNLPDTVKVRDLKARYETRSELNRELKRLRAFSADSKALETIENRGGARAIAWEFDYLKKNTERAEEFFKRQYEVVSKKVGRFPGERMQLDEISAKINLLSMDVNYMNQEQFRSYRSTVNEYLKNESRKRSNYHGFLSELFNVMTMVGIDEKVQKTVLNKFKQLSPNEFYTLYNSSDLIGRVYDLADSPIYGELKLNTDEESAKELIDTLVEEVDELVNSAKTNEGTR